jgi:hypothetical protein
VAYSGAFEVMMAALEIRIPRSSRCGRPMYVMGLAIGEGLHLPSPPQQDAAEEPPRDQPIARLRIK